MTKKIFLTLNDQIELLKSRGLRISNEEKLNWYLKSYNYQNFINAYNDPFMKNFQRNRNIYLVNANSDAIIDLFNFDRSIGPYILSNIQNIERKFSTALVYIICGLLNEYSCSHCQILNIEDPVFSRIFGCSKKDTHFKRAVFDNFEKNNSDLCRKYKEENNEWIKNVPFWSLSIFWSFGNIIEIYKKTNRGVQKNVMNFMTNGIFSNIDEFWKVMKALKSVRNRICHNNVLYNIEIKDNDRLLLNFIKRNSKHRPTNIKLNEIIKIIDIILSSKEDKKLHVLINKKIETQILESKNISEESKKYILLKMNFLEK